MTNGTKEILLLCINNRNIHLLTLKKVKSYSTTQPLAAKYSYIMYSVIDSSDTSFAYTENI